MKKIILTIATAVVFYSTTALATADTFYVKGNIGWAKLDKIEYLKSNNHNFFVIGVGYAIKDNIRAELTFEHHFSPEHTASFVEEYYEINNGVKRTELIQVKEKLKEKINAVFINGFVDLFDVGIIKIFTGAGIGMARIDLKKDLEGVSEDGSSTRERTNKFTVNNFTYAGHVGVSAEVVTGINIELTYSYKGFGKTNESEDVNKQLKGHHVATGVRFNI